MACFVCLIPAVEDLGTGERVGADVGDFDADGAAVGDGGVPGAFLQVERLVNGAVEIEHEMDAEAPEIVQDLETLAAGAAGVEVEDELVDAVREQFQVPTAAANPLDFILGKNGAAETVTVWGVQVSIGLVRGIPIRIGEGGEAAFDPIGIVTTFVEPEDDGGAGVEELAGDNDFVSLARGVGAGFGQPGAPGQNQG